MNKVDFGSKYEFKADKNPAPGQYDVESGMMVTKERKYEAMIRGRDENGYKRPEE